MPENKGVLDKVIYSYSAGSNQAEEENRLLRETVDKLKEELDRFKKLPLMICVVKAIFEDELIIQIPNGNEFLVNKTSECENLYPGDSVLVEQKNLTVIKKINKAKKFAVDSFVIIEKPDTTWKQIGGLKNKIKEIQEVIELPLKKPELFKEVGISPPKGILLHGPPGTGKTLLAKAVAQSTNSTFIEIVASELVQKFIGEGAKLVKEIFELAREKAPSIVFIDEIDALAAKRIEVGTSGEREVQRTFMQLLAELDGFKPLDNVKIIGATNRKDVLDPAVIRPGRLDRLIHIPVPDMDGKKQIFDIHTKNMKLDDDTNINQILATMDNFSGAEIKSVCTEAGYFAIRGKRTYVNKQDFLKAVEKVKQTEEENKDHLHMFG
ncbi:proteasome-activating nucleotidase [Candidatus Woesearchaeota archaeon]|nr:proteasome-activating nucleotidase [Candidatus Woesearchaeota archaeon]